MIKVIERHRYKDKEIFQTRRLTFEPYEYTENNMCLVMGLIKQNLTPDLLRGKKLMYASDVKTNKYYGHCYHASQALHFIMNTDQLTPMSAEDYRGEKHWWLQNDEKIYDVTAEQYYTVSQLPPHDLGKKSKWYGWKQRPQQISLELLIRVLGDRLISDEALTI
jgi:hypothetical protein